VVFEFDRDYPLSPPAVLFPSGPSHFMIQQVPAVPLCGA
jgi:ubiquitin-protein ligase